MKKTIALILTLGMILSMTACGGKSTTEEPATTEAITEESTSIEVASETTVPDDSVAEETNEAETTEETNEADSSQEIKAIIDAEARLLSFYHTADSTYIAAVYPKADTYAGGFKVGEEDAGINFAEHNGWKVAFTQAEGADWQAEDFQLHVVGSSGEKDFSFSADDMVSSEEYADLGLYRMGNRYVTFGKSLKYDYQGNKANKFLDLDIYICDIALLDQDSQLSEDDISEDAFALYAGEGTAAEDLFGTPCVFNASIYPSNDFKTSASVNLDFYPTQTSDTEEEAVAVMHEMIDSLMDTNPYFTYTDPEGNVYEFPLTYDDIPPAYQP